VTPKTPSAPLPQLPTDTPTPPVFGMAQSGQKKPGMKSPQASFLSAASVPTKANIGTKQLVGQ
jgi:hypothetical protein